MDQNLKLVGNDEFNNLFNILINRGGLIRIIGSTWGAHNTFEN